MSNSYPPSLQLHIDGEWIDVADRDVHHVINPATGKPISDLPKATKADLDRALGAADRAFPAWRDTPVSERAAILHKAANLMRERAPEIGRMMTAEQGKPVGQATGEVTASAAMFDIMAEEAKRCYGRVLVRPTGQNSFVKYQPVGPVAAFSP
ncbi:MAG: aldehyde dehydrogenase family protein, partial [Pseudomonadota bacterium]